MRKTHEHPDNYEARDAEFLAGFKRHDIEHRASLVLQKVSL